MGKKKASKKERKRNKGDKEANKETKSYQSVDILFPDFRAVSYLRVDICGMSKLTGMPVGFLLCTSVDSVEYDNFRNVTLCKTLKTNTDCLTQRRTQHAKTCTYTQTDKLLIHLHHLIN